MPHRAVTGDRRQQAEGSRPARSMAGNRHSHSRGSQMSMWWERAGERSKGRWPTVSEAEATSWHWQLNAETRIRAEAEQELQHELRPRHSSLNLTCCLFYFQTRFNVVYIYTILVPIIHPPTLHPLRSPLQVQVALCELSSTASSSSAST